MKIGIDIDEVIVEFAKHFLELFNKKYHKNFSFEDLLVYNLWESLDTSREEVMETLKEFNDLGLNSSVEFIKGSREGVKSLINTQEVFFITSRPEGIRAHTLDFIKENFSMGADRVIFTNDFWGRDDRGMSKSDFCRSKGIFVLIEDNADFSLEAAEDGISVVLFDKPWNRKIHHENILRAKSWEEILEKVRWLESKEAGK